MGAEQPIVTGEAVALELRPAGVGSRGVALVIDIVVQVLVTIAWVWAISRTGFSTDAAAAQAIALTLFVGTILGYPVGFETLWRGRTLGKAVMGLRVVRDDGGPIRFRHAFVRGLVGVVVDRPGISSGLLALIPMLMTKRSKRLGDLAAGTVVVQDRVPSRVAPAPVVPAELATWAAGLDLSGLSDALASEVRHFLGRARQLAPAVRDEMGNRLLGATSALVGPLPPGMAPWVYLQTVLAERSRREALRLSLDRAPQPPAVEPAPAPPDGPFAPPS
ncbi:MAG TPA: RDD family protein [Mycobacteriales bacterium]|nr:RDD family protein [Mycobacteriales bacterium]